MKLILNESENGKIAFKENPKCPGKIRKINENCRKFIDLGKKLEKLYENLEMFRKQWKIVKIFWKVQQKKLKNKIKNKLKI